MDIHVIPYSTLLILSVSLILSIVYSWLNIRDKALRYNMERMKTLMNEFKKYQKRFKETQDERYLQKALRVQKELLTLQRQVFGQQIKRMVITFVVFFALYYALAFIYGRNPVAYTPFRIPHDIRSVPVEYSGRIISGLTFIGWYFISSIAFALFFQRILDKINRKYITSGLKRLFS